MGGTVRQGRKMSKRRQGNSRRFRKGEKKERREIIFRELRVRGVQRKKERRQGYGSLDYEEEEEETGGGSSVFEGEKRRG